MKSHMCLILAVSAALHGSAFAGVYYWKGATHTFLPWDETSNWSTSYGSSVQPAAAPDGADAELYLYGDPTVSAGKDTGRLGSFDLGGKSRTIAGYSFDPAQGSPYVWHSYALQIRNGTLTINNPTAVATTKTCAWYDLSAGGHVIFPSGFGEQTLGYNGLTTKCVIRDGTEMEMRSDALSLVGLDVDVQTGGAFTFAPGAFYVHKDMAAGLPNIIVNNGTLSAPNGFVWGSGCSTSSVTKMFTVKQVAGTLTLGGDFTKTAIETTPNMPGEMRFELSGGTLAVTDDVRFYNAVQNYGVNEVSATMPDNASATVEIVSDAVLDMSLFTYGANAALAKTGAGALALSTRFPATLSVGAGTLRLLEPVDGFPAGVTFASGTTLEFNRPGNRIDSIVGCANMSFRLVAANFTLGDVILTSSDADLLSAVATGASASLTCGLSAVVRDGTVKIIRSPDPGSFVSEGEKDLSDAASWGGTVPAAGSDVTVGGDLTVAVLSPDSPAFGSIRVNVGATLKVVEGVAALPPIALEYPSKLLIAEGATVRMDTPVVGVVEFVNGEPFLPTYEISSGATLQVPAGTKFSNVDLKLYGTLRRDETPVGKVVFGGAAAGTTAYFAMTADGATIDIGGDSVNVSGSGFRAFVSPDDTTGKVVVKGPIVLRNTTFNQDNTGFSINLNNDRNLTWSFVLDNTVLPANRYCSIGGSVELRGVNGGRLERQYDHPGVAATLFLSQYAKLVFDGPGSGIVYPNADYNRAMANPGAFTFSFWEEYADYFFFRNGAALCSHDFRDYNGAKIAGMAFSNGVWRVPGVPRVVDNPLPPGGDPLNWMDPPFNGLHHVTAEKGGSVILESADVVRMGTPWHRRVTLANTPIVGEGGFVMTNATPGWTFVATMVATNNTATGRLRVAPCETLTRLCLNDGIRWAGTLEAGSIALTNLYGDAAASVSVGALDLVGDLPLRVWRTGSVLTADRVTVGSLVPGAGRIVFVPQNGLRFAAGDSFVIGEWPEADVPAEQLSVLQKNWRLTTAAGSKSGFVSVSAVYDPPGLMLIFR